jgi:O-antigen/teichoic acid export membrane protein
LGTSSSPPGPHDGQAPQRPAHSRRKRPGLRQALESIVPFERFGDERTILAGTGQSVLGLVVAVLATFGTQVLITRGQGAAAFGVVTLATQGALVLGFFSRFGMDMAAVRRVAIDLGQGERSRVRAIVSRASAIAAASSVVVAAVVFASAAPLARAFAPGLVEEATAAFRAGAVAIPFAALVQVYLGATRGLKVMRHTLYVFWIGQPVGWLVLILGGWLVARTVGITTLAYAVSWALATGWAAYLWYRETRGFGDRPPLAGEVGDLIRYGAPRAPAALFSQLLFWTDLFVLARFVGSYGVTQDDVGIYAAAARAAQVILLFIISVSLMFSPFVADLHARGERQKLDRLYKWLTRWTLAATLPLFILLAVTPGSALRLFGGDFDAGATALTILLLGQLVNVATGTVGFILIMVGRTGWDLVVYAASVVLDVAVAWLLIPGLGMEGAAVAGALTMVLSKLGRLYLVWRFVRIQPYDRPYLLLLIPTVVAALAGLGVHALLDGGAWQVDLVGTAAAVTGAYFVALVTAGLPRSERRTVTRLVSSLLGRRAAGPGPGSAEGV